ncbi:hypothetical protein M2347_003197 [Chryseobacterium sp. H1D6B]|nr:hypothetical protein [Chryseobacterium sp. H1D6B]
MLYEYLFHPIKFKNTMKNFRIPVISPFTFPTSMSIGILASGSDIPLHSTADDSFTFDHHL